jgi:hypothetical protein
MKLIIRKALLLILVALALVIATGPLAAQVYKTVDEDGNVTYTDQPPQDGSKPIKLREISVIEAPTYETATPATDQDAASEEVKEKPFRFLRKHYEDFAIFSPRQEESIWYSDSNGIITVAWNAPNPIEAGMQVTVSVDGRAQPATSEPVVAITGLERGEHTVTAELKDSKNRSIATATPVTFFIRQPNIYINRRGPGPRGGG